MDVSFLKPKFSFDKTIRIVITGGGSGGHTFPLIAVYRELIGNLRRLLKHKKFL